VRAELLPALSTGSAYAPAHRYFDVSSGISLHRSSEQVAHCGLCVLGARKTEKNLPPAKGAKFRRNQSRGREEKTVRRSGLGELGVPSTLLRACLAGEKIRRLGSRKGRQVRKKIEVSLMADSEQRTGTSRFDVKADVPSHFSWLRTRMSMERTLMSWV